MYTTSHLLLIPSTTFPNSWVSATFRYDQSSPLTWIRAFLFLTENDKVLEGETLGENGQEVEGYTVACFFTLRRP